jgi:DNA-binding transcriptional MerR regulator
MSDEPVREKLYYSIGEVARMLDVQTSAVRYWEKEFDILKPKKNRKGNRMFTPGDLKNIRIIHHLLKEKGMTIAGAKKKMSENPESVSKTMEVVDSLRKIRDMLTGLRDTI